MRWEIVKVFLPSVVWSSCLGLLGKLRWDIQIPHARICNPVAPSAILHETTWVLGIIALNFEARRQLLHLVCEELTSWPHVGAHSALIHRSLVVG